MPWGAWSYSFTKAVDFLRATGYRLMFRGFVVPVSRHGGFVVGWMWRTPTDSEPES